MPHIFVNNSIVEVFFFFVSAKIQLQKKLCPVFGKHSTTELYHQARISSNKQKAKKKKDLKRFRAGHGGHTSNPSTLGG